MNKFFTELSENLVDRQELRLSIKKIGNDLVVTATPNFKEAKHNIEMSGTPEEIDENFINEIKKPLAVKTAFSSNADEVTKELEEEAAEEKTEKSNPKKKPDAKKKADTKNTTKAKAPVAKESAKEKPKVEEPVKEKAPEKSSEEIKAASDKKQLEQYVKEGEQYMKDRKYPEAADTFKKALEIEPGNALVKQKYESADKWVRAIANL